MRAAGLAVAPPLLIHFPCSRQGATGFCIANRTKVRITTLAELLRSALADGEDCSRFRSPKASRSKA
jgi:hypothetical protein